MINIIYEFPFLPLNFQIALLAAIVIIVAWFKLPSYIISAVILFGLVAYEVDPVQIAGIGIVLAFFTLPLLRSQTLSRFIMTMANKFKIFPKVSSTEQAALDAGTVWMDRELFSGAPNIKTMMTQSIQPLSDEEKAFVNGPVTELCGMIDDWEIQRTKQIPDHIWTYVKDNKFLGMIIPKEYGGLGLSAIGHSAVIEKIASVSATMAITIMVPNSLGPAELLLHYGTEDQKERYLRNTRSIME